MDNPRENAPKPRWETPGRAALDLPAIRAAAVEGRPLDPRVILALCDAVEQWQRQASAWADNISELTRERDALLSVARAWADAIQKQDMDAIEEAERDLIVLVARHRQ